MSNESLQLPKAPSLKNWGEQVKLPRDNISIDCGWGRLIFAHTYEYAHLVAELLQNEKQGTRDIAIYLRDPQVVIAKSPHDLFIDPSYTFRVDLADKIDKKLTKNPIFKIEPLDSKKDIQQVSAIYMKRNMVPPTEEFWQSYHQYQYISYWVVRDINSQDIQAVAMSIDHKSAFDDPEEGASVWAVAVDPQAGAPGIGMSLMLHIMHHFKKLGRRFIDVSVLHDNPEAIQLYKKLGFVQVPVFCVKNKNAINEKLFIGPQPVAELNPYARMIVDEAQRRGIKVKVMDAKDGYFKLSYGGTKITCRESLSELTSAIAMSICADKQTTFNLLREHNIALPDQSVVTDLPQAIKFLKKHRSVAVKPANGEQGHGISLNITSQQRLEQAIEYAASIGDKVILEQMVKGIDLRIIVVGYHVVAAAIRRPPCVVGNGVSSIKELIKKQSRRREQATQGESSIPFDDELKLTVAEAGYQLSDVLPKNKNLIVRKTANLHQGGTIHDVTSQLHADLREVAIAIAQIITIPVVGIDFIVKDPAKPSYYFIEANERPGLANHEPQPTAEKFIDLLFPHSITKGAESNA